eukprot:TRINITY_DN7035_c0_g1_i1.p1 TRINITY_DN7035_c0_g1~~TRINITY_DN7035_c0_g1_i1.p1  ORF type:complete len:223 (+),score=26.75 TRINITY_DN7035_c0_g1_i1:299-967(+)
MSEDVHTALSVLELTTVHYNAGDRIALVLAYVTLIPLVIVVGFLTLLLFKRDLRTGSFFGGQIVNEGLNYILKKTLKEARPAIIKELKTDYGLPSSHAQFMYFFAVYATFMFLNENIKFQGKRWNLFFAVVVQIIAGLVAYSRVYLFYHTSKQVLVGCVIGVFTGSAWYLITEMFLRPYIFPLLEKSWIGEYFYLRDTTNIQNLIQYEYKSVLSQKKKNKIK